MRKRAREKKRKSERTEREKIFVMMFARGSKDENYKGYDEMSLEYMFHINTL